MELAAASLVCMISGVLLNAGLALQLTSRAKKFTNQASESSLPNRTELVSLIVCIQNGQDLWPVFWNAIQKQNALLWELIVVDDGSTDGTHQRVLEAQKEWGISRFRVVRCEETGPGKKKALEAGIDAAVGTIVLVTDVDCIPAHSDWIDRMTSPIVAGKDVALGVSFPMLQCAPGWVGNCQRLDSLEVARNYLGWAGNGQPYMGVGRNMAYRKSVFKGFSGHEHVASGDDDLLVQSWVGHPEISFSGVLDRRAQADTSAPSDLQSWMNQKTETCEHFSALSGYQQAITDVVRSDITPLGFRFLGFVIWGMGNRFFAHCFMDSRFDIRGAVDTSRP